MSTKKVLVPLASGFEEIEAVTIVDVLRRAGVDVVTAGLEPGSVTGSHGIAVTPDTTLDEVDASSLDMIALPGGMPGAAHLRDDARVQALLQELAGSGRFCAAICAAPIALAAAGISEDRTVTSYPGFEDRVACARYVEDRVAVDGHMITSRGPGTALEFALVLVEKLCGADRARELGGAMLVQGAEPVR